MTKEEIDFSEWFDCFKAHLNSLGYKGPIDRESAMMDYDFNTSFEDAAEELFNELNN